MLVGEVFARMGLDSKQYEKGLDKLEGVTQKRAMTLGSIFKGAFSVALGIGVFEAVKMGFQTIASTAIDFNAQMEQARIGFTTMLGSAERAEAFLRDMAEFAAKTPFEFPELLDASKRMLAYGFAAEDVLPTMEAVGNASAAVGLGTEGINRIILALGQMRAKGKLSAEEMRQLTETGIPAWEILAEAMNKTTAEIMDMQQKGLIPAHEAIQILIEGMNKRFPDMMKNMENTWEGVTSTIKDIWQMTIGKLTENLFEGLKTWLQGVRDWMSDFYDTFQQFGLQAALAKSFGPEIAALVSILSATLRGLASVVSAVTGFFVQYGKQIKFVAIVMGTYLALTKAVTLAKKMMIAVTAVERGQLLAKIPVLNVVSTAMGIYRVQMALAAAQGIVLTGVLAKLRVALFALWSALGPVGWIILGLSAAVGVGTHLWGKYIQSLQKTASLGFGDFRKAQEGMAKSAGAAADATEDQADALKEAGKAAGKNLQSFDEVHQLQEDMAGSAEDLAESMGFDDTELGAPGAGGFEIPDIEAQLEEMKPTLKGFWEWIKQGAGNLWEGVKEKWNNFIGWVSSWEIWTTLKEKWSGFKEWAGDLWEGVKEKWENFKEWAGDLWEGVKEKWGNFTDWVQEKWSSFKTKADEIWTGIKTNVQTKWEELKTNAPVIWEDIKTSIQTRWENLKTSAGETWNNITTGIEEKWNSLKTNAPIAWENIKTSIQDRWDSLVSGASEKWGNIKSTISEKWEELKTNAPTVWENIKDEISQRWEELKTNAPITWGKIKKEITDRWEALKKDAPETWENIKKSIAERWEELKTNAPITWGKIKKEITDRWEALKKDAPETWENIKKSIAERWEELKTNAPITWEKIKKEITDRWEALKKDAPKTWGEIAGKLADIWEGIKTSASEKWEGVKTVIKGAINGIIGFINKFIKAWNKIELKVPEVNIPLVGTVGGWSVRVPQIPEIPMLAKGGLVTDPTLAMLGEAGPEAVIPLGRSGFADEIAQAVYQAIMDAIRISRASSSQSNDDKELVLKIDNTVLARMQLPAIIREGQRQGLNLVVQPQGV
jgi:tape measure domain-containing protein